MSDIPTPVRASDDDWCEVTVSTDHLWSYTVHAGPLRIETRRCMACQYLSIQPIAERLTNVLAERDFAQERLLAIDLWAASMCIQLGIKQPRDTVAFQIAEITRWIDRECTVESSKVLSKLLFEARESLDMYADVVEARSGRKTPYLLELVARIDAYRAERGWSPNGFGGEQ